MIQQATFEYVVTGSLDGVTAPPAFSVNPQSSDYKTPDSANIYSFSVATLGLIEVGFMNALASGYRLITGFFLTCPNAGASNARIDMINRSTGDRLGTVARLTGVRSFYRLGLFIPQGMRLTVNWFTASAANPIRIRYNVVVPAVDVEFADLQRASRFQPHI